MKPTDSVNAPQEKRTGSKTNGDRASAGKARQQYVFMILSIKLYLYGTVVMSINLEGYPEL